MEFFQHLLLPDSQALYQTGELTLPPRILLMTHFISRVCEQSGWGRKLKFKSAPLKAHSCSNSLQVFVLKAYWRHTAGLLPKAVGLTSQVSQLTKHPEPDLYTAGASNPALASAGGGEHTSCNTI